MDMCVKCRTMKVIVMLTGEQDLDLPSRESVCDFKERVLRRAHLDICSQKVCNLG
jgi:hypothetical protein